MISIFVLGGSKILIYSNDKDTQAILINQDVFAQKLISSKIEAKKMNFFYLIEDTVTAVCQIEFYF